MDRLIYPTIVNGPSFRSRLAARATASRQLRSDSSRAGRSLQSLGGLRDHRVGQPGATCDFGQAGAPITLFEHPEQSALVVRRGHGSARNQSRPRRPICGSPNGLRLVKRRLLSRRRDVCGFNRLLNQRHELVHEARGATDGDLRVRRPWSPPYLHRCPTQRLQRIAVRAATRALRGGHARGIPPRAASLDEQDVSDPNGSSERACRISKRMPVHPRSARVAPGIHPIVRSSFTGARAPA